MSFLKKLFGGGKSTPATTSASPVAPSNPAEDPNMIRVYDAYGRELFITRQQWRDNVLLGNIKEHWNDAARLSGFIIQSLHDQFFDEMVKPVERLLQLEPDSEQSTVLAAVVYLKVKRVNDSENVLQNYIKNKGESGAVLTNLAKVYAERGDKDKSLDVLARALQIDPNQDNGLAWYASIYRDANGDEAGLQALRRIAKHPESWLSQLWLAPSELRKNNIGGAMALYKECLARAPSPAPTDLLMQMSGDLGNAGYLDEILSLVEPYYQPSEHGLQVGNNLIKAHIDLHHYADARKIIDQLYSLKRPDWKPRLSFWDTELAKIQIGDGKVDTQTPPSVGLMVGQGPIWLKPDSPAAALFPEKAPNSLTVTFIGSSAEGANPPAQIELQLADTQGRLSRAIPLFLAEQMEFRCGIYSQTLVPWIENPKGGFVLLGFPWTDSDAVNHAQQCEKKSDCVVISHLITKVEPWIIKLRVIATADSKCVGELSESFSPMAPSKGINQISTGLTKILLQLGKNLELGNPAGYTVPEGPEFPYYLLRLEQLLAVRCSAMDNVNPEFLNGERDIIDGNLQQCLHYPKGVNARLLLAQTLLAMKSVRPDILPEFSDRIALLQKEKPLAEPAQTLLQRLFDEAFTT